MINITKPYLPDLDEYVKQLNLIWGNNYLTNNGPLHKNLEKKLTLSLGINDLCLINNCTSGLLISINDIEPCSEIITTPFSFIATTSSILWSKLQPVFCDIDEDYLFIDTKKVENLITSKTKAILATHVFGNSGNIEELCLICKKHNIRLIFDAAHAFAVNYKKKSILKYGDISILSFHATKFYHTIEGGAIYSKNASLMKKFKSIRNFGLNNHEITDVGINAKMSEFCCAMGLCVMKNIDAILSNAKYLYNLYNHMLLPLFKSGKLKQFTVNPNIEWNYSYYPIIFNKESELLKCSESLKNINIFPRRYFYPSLNTLKFFKNKCKMKVSESISKRILCLPFYYGLEESTIKTITTQIIKSF